MKEALTKKYGPLPGWAWVLVIGGGAFLFLRSRGDSTDGQQDPGTYASDAGGLGAFGADSGTSIPFNPCVQTTNPAGTKVTVCGPGHWAKSKNGKRWVWVPALRRPAYAGG